MSPMKLPGFLQRKNSKRRGRREESLIAPSPLSPVSEHPPIPVARSSSRSPSPTPVPPPQHIRSHADDFEHLDMHDDDYVDGLPVHEPHSRLYETFSPSQDGRSVPRVIREGDDDMHHFNHSDAPRSLHPDEVGMPGTERSIQDHTVYIAPSEQSAPVSQKVTFMGNMPSHDRAMSMNARSMGSRRAVPVMASSHNYGGTSRYGSDYRVPKPPRIRRPEAPYEFRTPYLILTDFGDGLEIGNEEDGFMRYEDFCDTAHLRAVRGETYYIIPGSTPVVFHDENNNELYRVDASRYYTPWLRKRQYIIQDGHGGELFRVGGSRGSSSNGSFSSRSRSQGRVIYLPSDIGSNMHPRRPKYRNIIRPPPLPATRRYRPRRPNPHAAATPLHRSALFEDDDKTVSSQVSSNPTIRVENEEGHQVYDSRNSIGGLVSGTGLSRSPLTQSQSQSPYVTDVNYPSRAGTGSGSASGYAGPAVDRSLSPEYRWRAGSATTSSESDDYAYHDNEGPGSHRHSRVFRA